VPDLAVEIFSQRKYNRLHLPGFFSEELFQRARVFPCSLISKSSLHDKQAEERGFSAVKRSPLLFAFV
jgi:hypothetical protein